MTPPSGPRFEKLLGRLIQRLESVLVNGEYTERGLARLTGISQPHLHNILAGKRSLTPRMADAILTSVGWGIGDLMTREEVDGILLAQRSRESRRRRIPVLKGRIGPSSPFPDANEVEEWLLIQTHSCEGFRRVFLAALELDPAVPFARRSGAFALVAEDEELRVRLAPEGWYVLRWGGAGYVRRIRLGDASLEILGQESLHGAAGPARIPLSGQSVLSVVRGRLLWAGPDPRLFDPFIHSGSGFPMVTAS